MSRKLNFVFMCLLICIAIFFICMQVLATKEQKPFFTMEEIVVIASKYPEGLLDSTASVEVISREEITISQSENLAGIIRNIAGLEIMDYGSQGDVKAISIRGSSPEQVLILIDGQVVNDPQT